MWHPLTVERKRPERGDLIGVDLDGLRHKPWRVHEVTDEGKGVVVVALAAHDSPDLTASVKHYIRMRARRVDVLPKRFATCSCCGDLMPCAAEMVDRAMEQAVRTMARYDQSGVCPACGEVVTRRQGSATFPNVVVPLGPSVTFHTRKSCISAAITYELRTTEYPRMSCGGSVTFHRGGDAACTNPDCPDPTVLHKAVNRACLRASCDECKPPDLTHDREGDATA